MIYGQSGCGSKVTCLMGMPSAAGLFHRASVQSGGGTNLPAADQSKELARQVMKELGLGRNDLAALQKMDWAALNAAGNAAIAKLSPPAGGTAGPGGPPNRTPRIGWSPHRRWKDPDTACLLRRRAGDFEERTDADWQRQRRRKFHAIASHGGGVTRYADPDMGPASALIAAMKKAQAEKSVRALSYAVHGITSRNNIQCMVKLKYEQKGAPVYQYYFTWQSPRLEDAASGIVRNSPTASITPSAANKTRAIRRKRKRWPKRWRPPG